MSPKWFPLKCLSLIFFFVALGVRAQGLPPVLKEIEAKYEKSSTLQAKFTQTKYLAALKREKPSSGVIWLKRPNKFRWQIHKPDPNLLVSNGQKFWHYTPPISEDEEERGQVYIRQASQVQTRFAQALLAGSFSKARLKVQSLGKNRYRLIPKKGTAGDILRAEVQVDPEKKIIREVKLSHRGGNRTTIRLSSVELGNPLEDHMFLFQKPPGTDEIIAK